MSFLDRMGNKVDKMRSKQNENSDVNSYNRQIKEETEAIEQLINRIGEFYWNLYAKDEFDPEEGSESFFKEIEERIEKKKELETKIEERRKSGEAQRQEMDENTKVIEEKKAAEAAERKRQREEAKRIAAEERAAKEMAAEEEDEEQQ